MKRCASNPSSMYNPLFHQFFALTRCWSVTVIVDQRIVFSGMMFFPEPNQPHQVTRRQTPRIQHALHTFFLMLAEKATLNYAGEPSSAHREKSKRVIRSGFDAPHFQSNAIKWKINHWSVKPGWASKTLREVMLSNLMNDCK